MWPDCFIEWVFLAQFLGWAAAAINYHDVAASHYAPTREWSKRASELWALVTGLSLVVVAIFLLSNGSFAEDV